MGVQTCHKSQSIFFAYRYIYLKIIDNVDFSSFYMNYINIIRSQTKLCCEIFEKAQEEVEKGVPSDRVLSKIFRSRKEIGSRDRRLISDLIFSTFRWKGWLNILKDKSQEEIFALSLLLDGKTHYTIWNSWAQTLNENILSLNSLDFQDSIEEKSKVIMNEIGQIDLFSVIEKLFPPWIYEKLLLPQDEILRKKLFIDFAKQMQTRPPVWLRSSAKNPDKFSSILRAADVKFVSHPKVKPAHAITTPVNLNLLSSVKSAQYEVQELSSQAVGLVCSPKPEETWLDSCAGAGGKTLHLAHLLKGKGKVIAFDTRKNMLKKILSRSKKWGLRNISIIENKKKIFRDFRHGIDGVLVDAPCSGIGSWRRNPDARWRINESEITDYSELQYEILLNMSVLVKEGGALVFSVCSLTKLETRDCIKRFLDHSDAFNLDPFTNPFTGKETDGTIEIWPQENNSDGMFIAKMRKSI